VWRTDSLSRFVKPHLCPLPILRAKFNACIVTGRLYTSNAARARAGEGFNNAFTLHTPDLEDFLPQVDRHLERVDPVVTVRGIIDKYVSHAEFVKPRITFSAPKEGFILGRETLVRITKTGEELVRFIPDAWDLLKRKSSR
jgi:hypothetical protein